VHASRHTLDVLEWPLVVERLREFVRTPAARRRCTDGAALFATDLGSARDRLAETTEAKALLAVASPPLGGLVEIEAALQRAERGGSITAGELLDIAATIEAILATAKFLEAARGSAPRLAALAERFGSHQALADAIRSALDSEGQVRDAASPVLAGARADARRLAGEIQRRLDAALNDPAVQPYLSDRFVTVRHDRYVLPVRADASGRIRGIVHDASASGSTLFIEPQAVVDANNQLREAELRIERETARVLRALADEVGRETRTLGTSLEALEEIDLAFARGALSEQWCGVEPELRDEGVFSLPQLRHPLLEPSRAVPNDLRLGETVRVLVLSGPNAGGKTVAMKAVALAVLCARAGLHVAAAPGARVDWTERLLADIGDAQSLRENLSTFSAHLANLARIVDTADARTLVVLDEIGDGTDPGEGAALAQAVLEALASAGARVIVTTHYRLLKEMAQVDARFENASFDFDPETLAPTYRLQVGVPGVSSAIAVAMRMGLRGDVLERAGELLDRTDRRLERTLAELNTSRMRLEEQQHQVAKQRADLQTQGAELRGRLAELQARRDQHDSEMRRDLERRFRLAHDEVAGVIRELQRAPSAREAERARRELLEIAERAREEQAAMRAEQRLPEPPPATAALAPVDWRSAKPGDRIGIVGGAIGVLAALPDRRGRVAVQLGSARVLVPRERIGVPRAGTAASEREPDPVTRIAIDAVGMRPEDAPARGGADRCDLRGLRVDEALAELTRALDRAALMSRTRLCIVHGIGTGALRDAIRCQLEDSPYVARFGPAAPETGGEGVTEVLLC
jgi:DNA mismatch repair protein MutS2